VLIVYQTRSEERSSNELRIPARMLEDTEVFRGKKRERRKEKKKKEKGKGKGGRATFQIEIAV